jgi:hypothetical protein
VFTTLEQPSKIFCSLRFIWANYCQATPFRREALLCDALNISCGHGINPRYDLLYL